MKNPEGRNPLATLALLLLGSLLPAGMIARANTDTVPLNPPRATANLGDAGHEAMKEMRSVGKAMEPAGNPDAKWSLLRDRTEALGDHIAARAQADWARMGASPFTRVLIDARLFLTDAEIDEFVGGRHDKATKDLAKTLQALDTAAERAGTYYTDPVYKRQIAELRNDMRALMSAEKAGRTPYRAAEHELDTMIQSL